MPFGDSNGDGDVNFGERMLTNALIAEELEDSSPDGDGGGGVAIWEAWDVLPPLSLHSAPQFTLS